jgi:hypothetical protein
MPVLVRYLNEVISSVVNQYKPYDIKRKIELFSYSGDGVEFKLEVLPNLVEDKYYCRFNLHAVIGGNHKVGIVKASTVENDSKDRFDDIDRILTHFGLSERELVKITNALTLDNNSHYLLMYPVLYNNLATEAELMDKECSGVDRLVDCLTEVIKDMLRCYESELCTRPIDLIDYHKDKVNFMMQLCTEDTASCKLPSFHFAVNIYGDDDYDSIKGINKLLNVEEIRSKVKPVIYGFALDDDIANSLAYEVLSREGLKPTEKFTRKYEEICVTVMATANIIPV